MEYNPEKLLSKLMKNQRIKKRIHETKLTKKQALEALPILIDMSEQKDDQETKYLTSFYVDTNGQVIRSEHRSTYWAKFAYLENVKTLKMEYVDFEDEKKLFRNLSRKLAIDKMPNYLDKNKKTPQGLYFYGEIGSGKTFLMKRFAKKLAEGGNEIAFLTVANLAAIIKPMFREKDDESYNELVNLLKKIDFLFLDDIGSEQIKDWFRDGVMFPILDERKNAEKTTFFTSNYSIANLETIQAKASNYKYQEKSKAIKLISRIRALANEIKLEPVQNK